MDLNIYLRRSRACVYICMYPRAAREASNKDVEADSEKAFTLW